MREDLTEVAVVLDRSGSMEEIRSDAMGSFNAFLARQKSGAGELRLTLVPFGRSSSSPSSWARPPTSSRFTPIPDGRCTSP